MQKTLHPPRPALMRELSLPCLVILLISSLVFVFGKLIMKKWPRLRSATPVNAENTSSTSASDSDSGRPDDGGGEYEVFLSFRGEDTRKGFTDFLYTYLVDAGIRTFRDNEELRVGEEIGPELDKAIKESKISIPIFSKNYAESKWCLNELRQMVEMGHQIFPIFYDVEPSEVRKQRGSYEKAFRKHDKNVDIETVQKWKEALRKVGELKGLELKKETDGHEGELVKKVVEKVLKKLKKNYTVVPDNFVEIDHQIEELMGMLNVDHSNDVRIVGIYGMGGIGKTTISKVIFNQLCGSFESCCFLEDVRETSAQHNGLVNLQVQLISSIQKGKFSDIKNVDEGVKTIKDTVRRKRVLIVLDDVDDKSQFDKLAGKRDWFCPGSRIIVTARNKEVLDRIEGCKCYETPFMEPNLSLKLFSKYTFIRDHPPEGYDILSNRAVKTAARLPLALVVIGSLLFGKDKCEWEDTLRKLEEIPDKDIQKKLRISFEALEHQQKQIFLDIACLFIGEDKTYPFYMWDDCKFYPTNGINVLVRRSLVKVGDDNTLWMHDQLRDLGRYIVSEENFDEVGERSRLWRHEEALDILNGRTGTKKVVALCLDLSREESRDYRFTKEEFRQLTNLRFLQVDDAHLSGDFVRLLSRLRWLQWRKCLRNSAPTNFHLKNLVILDLSGSEITDDWEVWSQIKMAKKLKVLDLSNCHYLRITPDFSTHTALERLILRCCSCLEQIGTSIGNLINLKLLDVSECSSLLELPDALGNLQKLEELQIENCNNLRCILGFPSNLKLLRISYCRSLIQLPDALGNLQKLQELKISGCKNLRCILGLPSNLKLLHISSCSSLIELPDALGNLQKLEELQIENCKNLRCILGLPSNLKLLHIEDCESLERLPFCKRSYEDGDQELQEAIRDSRSMGDEGGELPNLRELSIQWCPELEGGLPDHLPHLTTLEILGCEQLKDSLPRSPLLCKLELTDCSHRFQFSCNDNLQRFSWPCLKELTIRGMSDLKQLPPGLLMQSFSAIESVTIEDCPSLESLPISDLRHPTTLKRLKIAGCGKLDLILLEPDSEVQIEHFEVCFSCDPMKSFPIGLFPKLGHLTLENCINLECFWIPEGVPPHDHLLTSLRTIYIKNCPKLENFPRGGLPAPNLRFLTIWGCPSLQSLPEGMHNLLPSLESLLIRKCPELESFPEGGLPSNLNSLIFSDCDKLIANRMQWGLQRLSNLEIFEFGECEEVESFPEEGLLPSSLTYLGIKKLTNLKYLDKRGLQHLSSLEEIYISECSKLECLPEEGLPNSLSNLSILRCSSSLEDWCRRKKEEGLSPIARIPEIEINHSKL